MIVAKYESINHDFLDIIDDVCFPCYLDRKYFLIASSTPFFPGPIVANRIKKQRKFDPWMSEKNCGEGLIIWDSHMVKHEVVLTLLYALSNIYAKGSTSK